MFVYYYRLVDLFDRQVASFAVLGDENRGWRPQHYGSDLWGTELAFKFSIAKLLDYSQSNLESSKNPFATVVLAHLKTQETESSPVNRKQWKLYLTRRLYEQGYDRRDVLNLFAFIDWLMRLPEELDSEYWQDVLTIEGERKVPYITSVERRGIQQGSLDTARESLLTVLEVRFSPLPNSLVDRIQQITELAVLKRLLKQSATVASLDEFQLPD